MDIPLTLTAKIKEEPLDEGQSIAPAPLPSQGLIEYFLDNEYKKEETEYFYNKVKCLDESDGKFRNFADVLSNQFKHFQKGDFKNHCSKCDKQFCSLLAARNHYIFTHPDSSLLASIVPRTYRGRSRRNRNYNWLDEPIRVKEPVKNKEESHIIIIKDKQEYLKKLCTTKQLVKITENVASPNPGKGYTLESIKIHPPQGIKVVKKSDIQFNELRTKAEKKLISSRRPTHPVRKPPPKKIAEPNRQLIKIDLQDALNSQSKLKLLKKFVGTLRQSQKTTTTYTCKKCNLEMFDGFIFDAHMRQHISATFGCSFCPKTFCTKIGFAKHAEHCKQNIARSDRIVLIQKIKKD